MIPTSSWPVLRRSIVRRAVFRGAVFRWTVPLLALLLGGCHSLQRQDGVPSGRLDPNNIVDAQPKWEPVTRAGNKSPYTVLGKTYTLLPTSKGYRQRGMASWYGSKFHGESTANGETYDAMAMTAAHCTLPIPSYVQVTNLENGRRAIVRVNDRGPFVNNRIIDLSYAAAVKLGYANKGTALVEVAAIDVDNWPPRYDDSIPTRSGVSGSAPAAAGGVVELPPQSVPLPSTPNGSSAEPVPAGQRHYVQVAAFQSLSAAQSLQRQLQQSTGQPVQIEPTGATPPLYRVRIGPLPSRDQAEQVRSNLVANGAGDARVISEYR